MSNSKIEWTDRTWNPTRGCSMAKGSESGGCLNCYAARMAARNLPGFRSPSTGDPFARLMPSGPRWTGKVELIESKLTEPLHWKKPQRVFVNSMSDLFHEALPDDAIERVFAVMALCPHITFQVLTKRPERMLKYLSSDDNNASACMAEDVLLQEISGVATMGHRWPLSNVWLGVSVEDQATADARIPLLLQTPAAIRFVSYEPALGPVDFTGTGWNLWMEKLSWIIAGGESGPGARPPHPDWFRSARDQCKAAGVAFFFKQWGEYHPITRTDGIHESPFGPAGSQHMIRVGKKKAGALLDGREWKEFPK
jgi:protein gp37